MRLPQRKELATTVELHFLSLTSAGARVSGGGRTVTARLLVDISTREDTWVRYGQYRYWEASVRLNPKGPLPELHDRVMVKTKLPDLGSETTYDVFAPAFVTFVAEKPDDLGLILVSLLGDGNPLHPKL